MGHRAPLNTKGLSFTFAWAYLLPLLGTCGVALVAATAAPLLDTSVPVLLVFVVVLSGWRGGFRPALVASLCSFLILDYVFESPPYSLEITDLRTGVDLVAFLTVSVLLGALNGRLRQAVRRADVSRAAAEAALLARDEALAVVSHDLRTPITAIQASVAALREAPADLPETMRSRLLGNIAAEADQLGHFVADALALGRLQAGVAPRLVPTDVGEIVSAVLDQCMPLLNGRLLTFDVPDSLPLTHCDPVLLAQTLTNLLDNIAAHTPPGTPLAVVGCTDGKHMRIDVNDAGPGIPTDARERVFGRFERLGAGGAGVGLGLALARAAIEAQGGRLWIEDSATLGGARFVIYLSLELANGEVAG